MLGGGGGGHGALLFEKVFNYVLEEVQEVFFCLFLPIFLFFAFILKETRSTSIH